MNLRRIIGRGWTALYEKDEYAGWHTVTFFYRGRKRSEATFNPNREEDAIYTFMQMTASELEKSTGSMRTG